MSLVSSDAGTVAVADDEASAPGDDITHEPKRSDGRRLSYTDQARMLELVDEGVNQATIAEQFGCHQSTVSRLIARYDDTRSMAKRKLNAEAVVIADAVVERIKKGDAKTGLKLLGKLDVVREDNVEPGGSGRTIVMGVTVSLEQHRAELADIDAQIRAIVAVSNGSGDAA